MKNSSLTEDKAEQTPTGGVLVGKRQGQTIIHNKGTLSGYLVGKTHAEGGIKAVNKSTGQALEMQGGEVVITAPAVSDNTKNEFNGKMMTNREILSTINEKGGGVSFAKGGDIPKNIKRTGASYKYGGKTMTDHEIYKHITGGHLAEGLTLTQIAKKHKVSLKEFQKQVDMGMKAESEHTSSKREQMKIVKDHLYENPKYYTLLKRVGLKHGGAVRRGSLVKDSKSGNTPARDLNNYNDVLDMDADGVFGAETGLYARGGKVKTYDDGGSVKELVEYITIGNQSSNPYMDLEKVRFYNFIDFKIFIKDLYANSGATNKREVFLCINRDDSIAKFGVTVSQGRNTNSNFNPFTGTFKDLEKNLQKFSVGNFDLFDWNRWGGVKTAKTTPSQTRVPNVKVLTKDELKDSKIWIGDDLDLRDKVMAKLIEIGMPEDSRYRNDATENLYIMTFSNDFVIYKDSKNSFDIKIEKEIFPADLGIDINNVSATPTATATTSGIYNASEIKLFEVIDEIIKGNNLDPIENPIASWANGISTKNFQFVDDETGEVFNLRSFNETLGVQTEDVNKDRAKGLLRIYINWKATQSSGSATPINAKNTIEVSRLTRNDLSNVKIWLGNNPELSEKIQKRAFELGLKWVDGDLRVTELDAPCLIFNGSGYTDNRIEKRASKSLFDNVNLEEIFVTDSTTTATPTSIPIDLTDTKIWIGGNPALSEKIQKRAFELGWNWSTDKNKVKYLSSQALYFLDDNTISYSDNGKDWFDKENEREIFESDLFGTTTPTSVPFDLKQKKIFIGDNPALSEKVQKKAFELGWFWETSRNSVRRTNDEALFFFNDKTMLSGSKTTFNSTSLEEITEADLFGTTSSQTSTLEEEMKGFDFSTLFPKEDEDWAKKFTADLDKLVTYLPNDMDFAPELSKEKKDLNALIQLLPSFQQSKYAIERAKILKEIKKLHYKLTYEGFIKPNEAISSDADLFTPQGLLDYYFTQATQNPTAELEESCGLPTPNGQNSKLPMSAYLNVRTEQFKNWFGDWEKAYENGNYVNCSKMIDPDTKEPKIYFHGVRKFVPNFGQFSNMGQGVVRPYGAFEPPTFPASYFAGEEEYAKFYGGVAENMPTPSADYKPFIYKVFLSVKNPISLLPLDFMLSYKDFMDYIYVAYGVKVEPNQELLKLIDNDLIKKHPMWFYVRRDIGFIEKIKDYGYDALFQIGDIPTFLPDGTVEPDRTKHLQEVEYLTFYPNQVKSATVKKSFYFDFFNDIRFKNGGYVRI